MKIKSLLSLAEKCRTEDGAKILLDTMASVFGNSKALSPRSTYNPEAYMEAEYPHVHLEFNQEISNHYITSIRPEIRDRKLSVSVSTQQLLDGLGMASCSWETVDGLDVILEPKPEESVESMARRAKAVAISFHAELIQRVGVHEEQAKIAARKSW